LLDKIHIYRRNSVFKLIEIMPEGQLATSHWDSSIRIWDLEIKRQIQQLTGHSGEVRALIQLNPEGGGHLASGSCDSTIKIWNITSGRLVTTLAGHVACVNDLHVAAHSALDHNKRRTYLLFSSSDDTTVNIWNLKNRRVFKTLRAQRGPVLSLLLINTTLICGMHNGPIIIWNWELGLIRNYSLYGHMNAVKCLIYLGKCHIASSSADYSIKIWNYETGDQIETLLAHINNVNSIVLLKNGHLASASADGTIRIWNSTNWMQVDVYRGHEGAVISLCVLKSGNLASASFDADIRIWYSLNEYNSDEFAESKKIFLSHFF
jgi:WD40 repeat protein